VIFNDRRVAALRDLTGTISSKELEDFYSGLPYSDPRLPLFPETPATTDQTTSVINMR
jgi:hypothetical protein